MYARHTRSLLFGFVLLAVSSPALDRAARAQNPWERGTELGLGAGAAISSEETAAAFDAVIGWDVTRWVSIDGRGSWFNRGVGETGFGAYLSGLFNLVPQQKMTPYVGAGFGFYHAAFDSQADITFDFYRSRIPSTYLPGTSLTFTDPAARFSGGLDIMASRNFVLRPEAAVIVVRGGGAFDSILIFSFRVAYRFEERPVTPNR